MTLEAPVPVACVSAFLHMRDLMALRAASRSCWRLLPRHTRALVGTSIADTRAMPILTTYFPHITELALDGCRLSSDQLDAALRECVASRWGATLRTLAFSSVLHITDRHLELCAEQLPALESLVVSQCYFVEAPTLRNARLRHLCMDNCAFSRFGAETRLPALETLRITSQALTTLDVRRLIKRSLPASGTPLRVLALPNCGAVTQVFVDPSELPQLEQLDLRSCHALERVHVASQSLVSLELAACVTLQHVVLDVLRLRSVDLSFLTALTHLFVRAAMLETLDIVGCSALEPQHVRVACPALQVARLSGTRVVVSDLRRSDQDMVARLTDDGTSVEQQQQTE